MKLFQILFLKKNGDKVQMPSDIIRKATSKKAALSDINESTKNRFNIKVNELT